MGALYVAGTAGSAAEPKYKQQYHIQLSVIMAQDPDEEAQRLLRYMPDVVATASEVQLKTSKDHIVLVCAVLGELEVGQTGRKSTFLSNVQDPDITTNSTLRVQSNSAEDEETWAAMEEATYAVLEKVRCFAWSLPEMHTWPFIGFRVNRNPQP